ncbi:hypothetical protein SCHPADRAFT_723523 [Schizopora paradoxa]|uniref:Uncharacterized protein n=1 Tax=Schizopora paradoxa TaxID=27342 RepID=A0A0H2R2E1_9AGAM|nr:hypothetical protein SCHPADRAFT_723523 [Schizopora paradoxa]
MGEADELVTRVEYVPTLLNTACKSCILASPAAFVQRRNSNVNPHPSLIRGHGATPLVERTSIRLCIVSGALVVKRCRWELQGHGNASRRRSRGVHASRLRVEALQGARRGDEMVKGEGGIRRRRSAVNQDARPLLTRPYIAFAYEWLRDEGWREEYNGIPRCRTRRGRHVHVRAVIASA